MAVDYDKTELGLTDEELQRYVITATWLAGRDLTFTGWFSYDRYESEQSGRSFRGGAEKNAFATTPPLPQASDPTRNWDIDAEDSALTLGFNGEWQVDENLSFKGEYSYVDTEGEYDFATGGSPQLPVAPLPDNGSTQHHLVLESAWQLADNVTIKLDYQYWSFDADDWSINGITPTSIDKVLTLGEQEADEDLHYVGTSIVYRWQ